MGYNYYLRFYNIKRKIEDLERNTSRLQKIVDDNFEPFIFQGGEVSKDGKKIFEVKKVEAEFKSKNSKTYSLEKKFTSIPYTEEAKYYLMVEIISETTQYCADLASIIIGLKDFETRKSTFSQIEDARIKKWYQDNNKPSKDEFVEILGHPPLPELSPEERFNITLNYEQFLWNKNKIGDFYWYNYVYLYTPYRHGMKGSFCRDSDGRVFCRTLTKDKKFNFFDLSDERIKKCQEISELIYFIFHNNLKRILLSKGLSPFFENLRYMVSEAPKLPIRSFNPKEIRKEFPNLKDLTIYYFSLDDIAKLHKFAQYPKNNLNFHYIKNEKGTSLFTIDGISYYLDSFFSFSRKLKPNEFLIIANCPFAYSIELALISIKSNRIYDFTIGQIKESIFHYLTVEKDLDYILKDPNKTLHRVNQYKVIVDEIIKDFIVLISLYYNKEIFSKLENFNEELDYFIHINIKKMVRLLNTKSYMKKFYPDIILQIIIQLLIIDYFKFDDISDKYSKELKIEGFKNFLKKSSELILKSVKNNLELEILLEFMNLLYNVTNKIVTAN